MNDNVDQHGNIIPGLDEDGNPTDGNVGAGTTAPAVAPEPTPEPEPTPRAGGACRRYRYHGSGSRTGRF